MWLAKTVAKSVVLLIVAIGLLGVASASAPAAPTALPLSPSQSGDFAVDSFFDITYEIEFVGAPGSVLDGMSGTTQGTVRVDVNTGCVIPDNGTGTADLPPLGCQYQSLDDVWYIIDGLLPGDTIEIDAIIGNFFNITETPGGTLGGDVQIYDAIMELTMTGTGLLTGFNRNIDMQVAVETHSGPRTPGDPVQTFPTDMVSLHGEIFGDPDFDYLRITAGTAFGLPSPGETTLTKEMDYGDAPDPTYPTLMVNNGASHPILAGFNLGPSIDGEPDGQPDPSATGDDLAGLPDEDGVSFIGVLLPGQQACVDVTLTNTAGVIAPSLDAWIDFDANGKWDDPVEHLWNGVSQPLGSGSTNHLCFQVPPGASRGPTFARFRLSDGGGIPPFGPVPPGEVEDYEVYIEATKCGSVC